jgi:hypothetical protein
VYFNRFITALRWAASLCLVALASTATGAGHDRPWWQPDGAFVQYGVAEDAQAITGGGVWQTNWSYGLGAGRLGLYFEVSLGRWRATLEDGSTSSAWVSQIGITPVLRWTKPAHGSPWFAEIGVGANVLTPIYRSGDKSFSTAFNFGDHLALGRTFGVRDQHEIAVRLQHFSNAGIKHPNPGEDFVQIRYLRRL